MGVATPGSVPYCTFHKMGLGKLLNIMNFFGTTPDGASPSSPAARAKSMEAIIDERSPTTVTKEDLKGVPDAFLLHGVLTEEECKQFIAVSEQLGYREAGGTGDQEYPAMPDMRQPADNVRAAAKASHPVLYHLWKRVRDHVPSSVEHSGKTWKVREDENALNEQFRFLRYEPQQRFWAHFDGGFKRSPSEQTHFTFIMYLNDDFEGGDTVIFPEGNTGVHGAPARQEVRVRPERGMALVFRHSGPTHPLHSGAPHTSPGKKKYILRSDIMYLLDEE